MSEPVVKTIELAREYHRGKIPVPALNGVDLKIEKGEVVGIIGPSGSGKTTLLNLIGGLDRPTHGEVLVDGVDLSQLNDAKLSDYRLRKIGFVFQFYNLISTLTAIENVELPMNLANVPRAEQHAPALDLLKRVGLESRANHMPDELSGGEQQRVAVARALANNPSVLLADEPTGDLDSKSAKALMELIKSLQKDRQATFVIVTHDPIVVTQCDRAYAIRDGKVTHELLRGVDGKLTNDSREMMDSLY
ncbi:MAG: ABC transporter ATP-binding protein [Nitrososphaerales archaeon]